MGCPGGWRTLPRFFIQEFAWLDCTTPIPQRRGTGLAFPFGCPTLCESQRVGVDSASIGNVRPKGPKIPTLARTARMGHPAKPGPPAPIHSRETNKSSQNWPCSMNSVRLAVRIRNRHSSHRLQAQFHTSEGRSSCLQIQLRLDLLRQTHG